MKRINWSVIVSILAVLLLSACGPAQPQIPVTGEKPKPATVEKIDGSEFSRVTLTEKAAERLDIQTAPVRFAQIDGSQYKVIPYSAVMYGLNGETWAYANPEPLVYIRLDIAIDHIEGNLAILLVGPEVGTEVVVVGAPMLYGAEVGVAK